MKYVIASIAFILGSYAQAISASAQIKITVYVPSFCFIRQSHETSPTEGIKAIDLQCNVRSSPVLVVEPDQSVRLSLSSDCQDPQIQIILPGDRKLHRVYACNSTQGTDPATVTITVL